MRPNFTSVTERTRPLCKTGLHQRQTFLIPYSLCLKLLKCILWYFRKMPLWILLCYTLLLMQLNTSSMSVWCLVVLIHHNVHFYSIISFITKKVMICYFYISLSYVNFFGIKFFQWLQFGYFFSTPVKLPPMKHNTLP